MKNKKYKLLKKYPTLPDNWEVGMEVKSFDNCYSPSTKYYRHYLSSDEVENFPEYWQYVSDKPLYPRVVKMSNISRYKDLIITYDVDGNPIHRTDELYIKSTRHLNENLKNKAFKISEIELSENVFIKEGDCIIFNVWEGPTFQNACVIAHGFIIKPDGKLYVKYFNEFIPINKIIKLNNIISDARYVDICYKKNNNNWTYDITHIRELNKIK